MNIMHIMNIILSSDVYYVGDYKLYIHVRVLRAPDAL